MAGSSKARYKRAGVALALAASLLLGGCSEQTICGRKIEPYGLFNSDTQKSYIEYRLSILAVVIAVVGSETVIVPIVVVGWLIMEPSQLKEGMTCADVHVKSPLPQPIDVLPPRTIEPPKAQDPGIHTDKYPNAPRG